MNIRTIFQFVFLMALIGTVGGCATIVDGTHQSVSFNSTPDGATVMIDGRPVGKTPTMVSLEKKEDQTLSFSKEGYKPLSMKLETRMDGWFWGNIVCGGFLGSTTDGLSGAVDEYSPGQYLVTLQPEDTNTMATVPTNEARRKAEKFIVLSYKEILNDLGSGEGPYLNSLYELLKIPKDDRGTALKKIRALSEAYSEIPDFADRVIQLYLK
jgi:hypothetical protein